MKRKKALIKFEKWLDERDYDLLTWQREVIKIIFNSEYFGSSRHTGKTFLINLLKEYDDENP